MSYDVVANVVPIGPMLIARNLQAAKSAIFLKCLAYSEDPTTPLGTCTTEPVPVVGDANRWFAVALEIPYHAKVVKVQICITPLEAYTPLTVVATVGVDLETLITAGRLKINVESSGSDLKLVVCPRDRPSPLENKLFFNTMQAAYAFPGRNTIMRETLGEVKFGYSVPADFLRLRISQLQTQIDQYQHVLTSARQAQGIFSSDEAAVASGYYPCAIRVVGARNLEQVQRLPGSKSLSSPFVNVSIKSPRFQTAKQVGRTNTEYRTADPVFGANSNVLLAEHAKPCIDFEAGRFGRICNDGIWMETYLREDESLTLTVLHERHSVYQGLTNAPMCSTEISFDTLAEASSSVREIELKNVQNPTHTGGTLFVVAFLREKPSNNPFDLLSTTEAGDVVSKTCKGDDFPNLLRIPTYWLSQVIHSMNSHLGMLQMMAKEINVMATDADTACFKSSRDKKKLPLAAMTTNLHQVEFSIGSTQSPFETRSRYAFTTCGVPSAIALGVENMASSLFVLKQKLAEAERELAAGTNLKLGFDIVASAFHEQDSLIAYGAEQGMAACPLTPPCSKPRLCIDETCGAAFHRSGTQTNSAAAAAAKTTSNTLRSAAASFASRFTTSTAAPVASTSSGTPVEAPVQEAKSTSPSKWQTAVELQEDVAFRETVAVSQALAPVAAAFLAEMLLTLNRGPADAAAWGEQLMKAGFLLGWESLISTHGKEMCMLSDVIGVVQFLNAHCRLRCRTNTDVKPYSVGIHEKEKEKDGVMIIVNLPSEDFRQLFTTDSNEVDLAVYVVLFSQGVNETQSISNFMNKEWAAKQAEINRASIQKLVKYALLFNTTLPLPVLRLNAIVENQREDEKEVDVLLLAEDAVRALKGARQVMCKSGKDRTAMAVTLEQSRIGANSLNTANVREMANLMREFGVRIRVAEKNVGARMYSFNVIQRMALPADYRPPMSVIQDMATSYSKKDS